MESLELGKWAILKQSNSLNHESKAPSESFSDPIFLRPIVPTRTEAGQFRQKKRSIQRLTVTNNQVFSKENGNSMLAEKL